jgi:carboxymethylenebutenolidase
VTAAASALQGGKQVDKRIIDLYDDFIHTHFDRRLFIEKAAQIVGGTAAATALLSTLQPDYARATTIAENDPRITIEQVTFKGATGDVKGYLAKPAESAKHGGVVVVHQNLGVNPHIEDIARRLAAEGYVALAVDFMSPFGGTPNNREEAVKIFKQLDIGKATGDANAAVAYLRSRSDVNGKVGAVGFCWGGSIINRMAVSDPTLNAAVVYYGAPPDAADVAKIKVPLLLNYADPKLDKWLGPLVPGYEEALKAANIKYELFYYQGANHGFNDDTGGVYNEGAAKNAWQRTMALFKANLS